MNGFLRIIAYFCIGTTPLQIGIVIWGLWVVMTTDFGILSLSHTEFFENYFTVFIPIVDWLYTWLWNPYLDFIFSLPVVIAQALKAAVSTWLGFWILRKIN